MLVFWFQLKKLRETLKEDGQIDLAEKLEELQSQKMQILLQEKQIVGLIKDINKMQEMCNIFEIENTSLR